MGIRWTSNTKMEVSLPLHEVTNLTIKLTPTLGHDNKQKVECLWNGVIEDDSTSNVVVMGCNNRRVLLVQPFFTDYNLW